MYVEQVKYKVLYPQIPTISINGDIWQKSNDR